jgi:hypothetical protein
VYIRSIVKRALSKIAAETQPGKPVYLALALVRTDLDITYKVDIAESYDPRTEAVVKLDQIDVIVPKKQRERLNGTIIHFNNSPARQGIVIGRLYPWAR